MDELFVRVRGGGGVCVPASPSMTTYVLLEQEDWFEKEIAFVRRALRPGMRAVDIGANYGLYTLAMARAAGPQGAVWAYEPASATAGYLRRTIDRNALTNVDLHQTALSDRHGTARLRHFDQSELNRLADDEDGAGEEVKLTGLDAEQERRGWGRIDFIKIDAVGEELNIIRGGERFFAEQSPLVMFERTRDGVPNEAVAAAFRARGYRLYRLIGPDQFLVPVDAGETFDAFEINLFACKPDRADAFAAAGVLAAGCTADVDASGGIGLALWRQQAFAPAFPQAASLDRRYEDALDAYAAWRDTTRRLTQRWGALRTGAAILRALAHDGRNFAHLSTCARVAEEAGMRLVAVESLRRMLELLEREQPVLREPFWPPAPRYDAIRPRGDPRVWFLAATIEAYEQRRAFSSCLATAGLLKQLDWLQSTEYASAEMERRRQLFAIRVGRQRQRQPSPLLVKAGPAHLNPQLWGGR